MGTGIVILFISAVWSLILISRVESFMGQKFLLISGNNFLDAKGIALSNGAYLFLWLIAENDNKGLLHDADEKKMSFLCGKNKIRSTQM